MENMEQLIKELIRLRDGIYEMDYFLSFGETELEKIETDDELIEFVEDLLNPELSEIEGFKIIVDELKLDFEDKHMQCIKTIKNALEWVDSAIEELEAGVLDKTDDYDLLPPDYDTSLFFRHKKAYKSSNTFHYYLTDMIEVHSNEFLQQHLPNVDGIDDYDKLYEELQSKIKILNNLYEDYLFTD